MIAKRRICVVLTARGNYAKMKSVISRILQHPSLELQVIVGGSLVLDKYGKILENTLVDDFPVNYTIHFLVEGETPLTMAKSAGLAVTEFANAFDHLKPDVVIVIADRFECLAITMAATYMNIPVAHVEGGEISGSIDESIRHSITKMAHLHFPSNLEAANRIARMGEDPDTIFDVGSTSFDVLANLDLDDLQPVRRYQLSHGVGNNVLIEQGAYLVVIQHPVTTEYSQNFKNINETVKAIHELKLPTFWIWPNMDAGSDGISKAIRIYREKNDSSHVHFFKSLPIELFGPLLKNAACIVGNSSSGIREAAFLGTPTVNIGSRQQGRDRGQNVLDVVYDYKEILIAIRHQINQGRYPSNPLYGDGNSAGKIIDVLETFVFRQQKQITF